MSKDEERDYHFCDGTHFLINYARWQKVSRQTIYNWCNKGMPHTKNKLNRVRIPCREAYKWLNAENKTALD